MRYARYMLAIGLLTFAVQAKADWDPGDIKKILTNVQDVWDTVTNEVKQTALDLQQQLNSLNSKGQTLRDTVQDMLDYVQHHEGPFRAFVGPGRCGAGSPCAQFRTDLDNFVLNMADLDPFFPAIRKHGLGDGTILVDVIDHMPPIALFVAYQVFQRIPDWQAIPQNLMDLYAEIGDAGVWSLEPPQSTPTSASVSSAAVAASTASAQVGFGSPALGTELFCSQGKERANPVRGNRVKAFVVHLKTAAETVSEYVPEDKVVGAGGETTSVHLPLRAMVKSVAGFLELTATQLETYYANIEVCGKVEAAVAACTPLVEYRTKAGVRKAYWVVKGVAQANKESSADSLLSVAAGSYTSHLYVQAYQNICSAYQQICANSCGSH